MKILPAFLCLLFTSLNLYSQQSEIALIRPNTKEVITTEYAPSPIGPYSQAIMANGMLFVSGQIALDMKTGKIIDGDIQKESETVMEYLKTIITKAGFSMQDIVKTTIFLTDMNNFQIVNKVYAAYFSSDFPARETVQVAALPKGARVEISVICVHSAASVKTLKKP